MIETDVDLNPRLIHSVQLEPLDSETFKPFGAVLQAPSEIGGRASYTEWLGSRRLAMTPRLHLNRLGFSTLPLVIDTLERHPHSAQIFLPISVSRFIIVVAPTNESGDPDLALTQAFLAPGDIGVIYAAGVWHAGATVLDHDGSFGVLMWRNDTEDDEEFCHLDTSLQVLA